MYPVLFSVFGITIHTYGVFVALGFLSGMFFARMEAKRIGIDPEKIMDLIFFLLIAAIIGSRLAYVLTQPAEFFAHPLEIFKIWKGGLVFYGGFLLAAPTTFYIMRLYRLPIWKTADLLAPALAFGHFLGRIGCFFAGCCYGKICSLPWAITFTHKDSLAIRGVPLHPTQLYSALGNLAIFLFLMILRRYKRFDGQIFWIYIVLYAIFRSIIEEFRDDFRGQVFFNHFSVSQTIALFMIVISCLMLFRLSKKQVVKKHSGHRPINK